MCEQFDHQAKEIGPEWIVTFRQRGDFLLHIADLLSPYDMISLILLSTFVLTCLLQFQCTIVEAQPDMGGHEHSHPVTLETCETHAIETYAMMSMSTGFPHKTLGSCTTAHQTGPGEGSCPPPGMMITTPPTAPPHAKPSMCSNQPLFVAVSACLQQLLLIFSLLLCSSPYNGRLLRHLLVFTALFRVENYWKCL